MTRKSPREIERAVEALSEEVGADAGEPMEIVITDRVVDTDHEIDYDGPAVRRTRVWRDEAGEWHSEEIDVEGADGVPPERGADR